MKKKTQSLNSPDSSFNVSLSKEQLSDLTIILNVMLSDRNLAILYGNRLNELFKRLTGKDHKYWGKNRCLM